jgi:hypothetical protein
VVPAAPGVLKLDRVVVGMGEAGSHCGNAAIPVA